jgi:hypothetical protein
MLPSRYSPFLLIPDSLDHPGRFATSGSRHRSRQTPRSRSERVRSVGAGRGVGSTYENAQQREPLLGTVSKNWLPGQDSNLQPCG